ncbi:MAG: HAD family phosphatase [Candidatus Omnitrophica bacterium]|nr:HAD family phosphatase [Candidatus Omnitrophota bacterium]HPP01843.1 HAD family phosphatase [bacterium]HXK95362.1 HAD family phosphatase [bacterium]
MMKAVIFDMDGVLIDSEKIHQQAEIHSLGRLGVQVTPADLKPFAGASRTLFREGLSQRFGHHLDWDAFFAEKDRVLFERMKDVKPVPGVLPLLQELQANGMRLAVATSSQRPVLAFIMEKFNLDGVFDVKLCANDITRSKPDPEIFLLAADRLGIPPEDCAAVEDSINGVRAAKAAGMYTIAITTSFPREQLDAADLIIDRYEELPVEVLLSPRNAYPAR